MRKHLGRREREARKRIKRGRLVHQDSTGVVTLKLGRKKSSEIGLFSNDTAIRLKKKFSGCVVEAER